jgi:hypothetical protein
MNGPALVHADIGASSVSGPTDVLGFYDRWVNGRDMRSLAALRNSVPNGLPNPATGPAPVRVYGEVQRMVLAKAAPGIDLPALSPERLRPIRSVILHGSQATSDTCAFSDVDIAVVLEDRIQFAAAAHRDAVTELKRLLRAIYAYDPLMHHGLMFLEAGALDAYDQSFLPLDTLRVARVLHGSSTLEIRQVPPDARGARLRASRAIATLRRMFESAQYEGNDYAFKRLLSNVLLFPALIAAARGDFVYKRESFGLVREWFSGADWAGIERSESLRSAWRRPATHLLQRCLSALRAHPCAQIRWSPTFAPRANVQRVLGDRSGIWRDEIMRTLRRGEELLT